VTTDTSSDTRIIGTMRRIDDDKGAVRMEDVYATDIEDLWSALTDPARLARWIGEVSGELRVGGRIQARFTSSWEGPGRIEICERPHRLAVTLTPGAPDETVVEATLAAEGDKTRLVIEERGLPLKSLDAYGAGWQTHVEDLSAHLAGRPASDWRTRWTALRPAYRDLLGGVS
jgi:uncharacterized protein YndB with AHSA1/START domain